MSYIAPPAPKKVFTPSGRSSAACLGLNSCAGIDPDSSGTGVATPVGGAEGAGSLGSCTTDIFVVGGWVCELGTYDMVSTMKVGLVGWG